MENQEAQQTPEAPPAQGSAEQQPAENISVKPGEFETLPFPVRAFGGGKCRYHVYKSPEESVDVEAETAAEALKASGVPAPWRIVREIPGRQVLFDRKRLLG